MERKERASVSPSWFAGLLLLLPLLLFLPDLNAFPYPPQAGAYSDLAVTHYPLTVFLRQALIEFRSVPLWYPGILSGTPFVANPLSGLMYLPGWLALILPLPAGFNILAMLHLVWGGLGMLFFLRRQGLGFTSALLGGLAFELMPKVFAHYGAGHLTLIYAISWTPWLMWAWNKGESKIPPDQEKTAWRSILPGAVLALVILADVRWGIYAIGLLWAYGIAHSLNLSKVVKSLFLQSVLAMLLAAPLLVPLVEFTRLSTRSNMTASDTLAYSLPAARLLGMVFPDASGNYEWTLYPGAMVVCLALAASIGIRARKVSYFWMVMAILTLVFSMGAAIPGARILASLPGFSLLRVPSRILFLFGFSMCVLASDAFEAIVNGLVEREVRRVRLYLLALASFTLAITLGVLLLAGSISLPYLWGSAAILAASLWLAGGTTRLVTERRRFWVAGLFVLCLADLGSIDMKTVAYRPSSDVFGEGAAAAAWLAAQQGVFRVYSPSYSLPQQTAARNRLQLADGIDPLQLANYASFMEHATGVPRLGYSVTMPPLTGEVPATANVNYHPSAMLLGVLNVRFVAAEFDVVSEGLVLKERFGDTRIYENTVGRPRAWVQSGDDLPGGDVRPAQVTRWRPDRIAAQAEGTGLFVLSEIHYPGWLVWVDGKQQNVEAVGGLLRGVALGPGSHEIIFRFLPTSLYLGLIFSLIGITSIIWIVRSARFR